VKLTEGNVADFERSLEMVAETLGHCRTYFEKNSEAMAAMHASTKVMYSPVVTLLDQAQFKVASMQNILKGEAVG
jgi:hypothetical protein